MSPTCSTYDVAIVGASLSGCAAAVTLAQAGLRVAMFDKAHPFREKPCGEGLSASGIAVARRLGFWSNEAPPVPFHPYHGFTLRVGDVERIMRLRRCGISVERRFFDAHVMHVAAATPGVDALFGVRATARTNEWGVTVSSLRGDIEARYLIVADGSNSPVAKDLGVRQIRTAPPRLGAACHYRGRFLSEPRFVRIDIAADFEIYATPLADGGLTIAVLAPLRSSLNPRLIVLDRNRLRGIFEGLQFEGENDGPVLGRAPIGGVARFGAPPGVFLVGDAAEEFDPIGGMGMTHALLSGELAGHTILATRGRGSGIRTEMTHRYEGRRSALARPFRRFTALTYRTLRSSVRWPVVLRMATSRFGECVTDRLVP